MVFVCFFLLHSLLLLHARAFHFLHSDIIIVHCVSFVCRSKGTAVSVANILVLIASLAGSLIGVFATLVPILEARLNIKTVWGAPIDKSDVLENLSERVAASDMEIEDLKISAANLQRGSFGGGARKQSAAVAIEPDAKEAGGAAGGGGRRHSRHSRAGSVGGDVASASAADGSAGETEMVSLGDGAAAAGAAAGLSAFEVSAELVVAEDVDWDESRIDGARWQPNPLASGRRGSTWLAQMASTSAKSATAAPPLAPTIAVRASLPVSDEPDEPAAPQADAPASDSGANSALALDAIELAPMPAAALVSASDAPRPAPVPAVISSKASPQPQPQASQPPGRSASVAHLPAVVDKRPMWMRLSAAAQPQNSGT